MVEQVRSTQYGARPASGTEHFGFFDGVAQPQIEGIKGEGIRTGEFIFGYQNEYGFFPAGPSYRGRRSRTHPARLGQPFSSHAPAIATWACNGTFVVYRKLAQDVAALLAFSAG